MDPTMKERGILKSETRHRSMDIRLTPQGSGEYPPSSPHPSVDRLSVTWAEPDGMASPSGANLFQQPAEPTNSEVKFSVSTGVAEGTDAEDDDYSASLSAVLRQRRASERRSRKGRTRRPSSPFLIEETRHRRRSSVFTISSEDTAISIEEGTTTAQEQPEILVTQEQIFENIHLNKEVIESVKYTPQLDMRRKMKIVRQAKKYIRQHEGQLQQRLAQSRRTKDIYARFTIVIADKLLQIKREAANISNFMIPWELRIKEIESHFGSVVASYFTFLRWLFWINLVIGFTLLVFVIVPECLTANKQEDGERKLIMEEDRRNSTNLLTLWKFDGLLKYSPIFYGYYSNIERQEYRMPLAYFLTGLVVYIYSFVAILRKMAENSRITKLSEKEDECIFAWKLFTGWDFMIGNAETAHNRMASITLGFKEALLEEAEKKKNFRDWKTISLRMLVNVLVIILLAASAYAVVTVESHSDDDDSSKPRSWWRENESTIVVTVISMSFPLFFEILGYLEHYHPRKQLRLQLARIMLLNLLNLYSVIFALFNKIENMTKDLDVLKPSVVNTSATANFITEYYENTPFENMNCTETQIPCLPCSYVATLIVTTATATAAVANLEMLTIPTFVPYNATIDTFNSLESKTLVAENNYTNITYASLQQPTNTLDEVLWNQIMKLRNISANTNNFTDHDPTLDEIDEEESNVTVSDYITSVTDLSDLTMETKFTTFTNANIETDTTSSFSDVTETQGTDSDFGLESIKPGLSTTQLPYIFTDYYTETKMSTKMFESNASTTSNTEIKKYCPDIHFNCTVNCGSQNITQAFHISNCAVIKMKCYNIPNCERSKVSNETIQTNQTNTSVIIFDYAFLDDKNRKMYNLTINTKKKLQKLCWETMFGQELVKLTMMDLVFVIFTTLLVDFFRALLVRYLNPCWCWNLEKKYPEYGDFKIAENILHLVYTQGLVWMGMFFAPGLVVLNIFKLVILMYLRSWAVMTCNVPHEVVFRVSKSNNFYLGLLLSMLFLCVLPVGYTIVWVKPSWHCGPFSEYDKIYHILTNNIYKVLPKRLKSVMEYITSPAIVIPLLVLLILIIYYLLSLTNSLREANSDLKIQLRRERTEERRKMFQLADTRRKGGASAVDNTPLARWKRALPTLTLGKSIDSDEQKTGDGKSEGRNTFNKKKGGIFAKIVNMALDRKTDVESVAEVNYESPSPNNAGEETDTDFHETLPKDILKMKDIFKKLQSFKRNEAESSDENKSNQTVIERLTVNQEETHKDNEDIQGEIIRYKRSNSDNDSVGTDRKLERKRTSESSTQSKQSDSLGSVIPVIMISTTESDEESSQLKELSEEKPIKHSSPKKQKHSSSEMRTLKRQTGMDSIIDSKSNQDKQDK